MSGILTTRSLANSRQRRYWSTASVRAYDAAVLADSPAGYWRLDETSGTVAVDSSGNGRNGVYVGSPTLSSTGCTLNGTSQCITFPSTAFDVIGNTGQDYTFEIWVSNITSGPSNYAIMDKTNIGSPDWNLLQSVVNVMHFQIYAGAANPVATAGIIAGSTERILHAVRTSSTLDIYGDGMLLASVAAASGIDCDNTTDLCIGARGAGTDRFLPGKVRRAAVYLTALTQAQIAARVAARDR